MKIVCKRKADKLTCHFKDDINEYKSFATLDYIRSNTEDKLNFTSKMLDLLSISQFVLMVDKGVLRSKSIDKWMRILNVDFEVINRDFWLSKADHLTRMLNFLSGDKWDISFSQQPNNYYSVSSNLKSETGTICMLSGGLDSLIGAIDLLENKTKNLAFVSILLGGSSNNRAQIDIRDGLKDYYKLNESMFSRISVHTKIKGIKNVEDTSRTRSFVYFTTAIASHWMYENTIIVIPENGFISLNVPISNSRLGSSTTRTTNQYYLNMLEQLYRDCEINVQIQNPYKLMTKGEMLVNCLNPNLLMELLPKSISCAHPDNRKFKTRRLQCGYCWPCFIRRASLKHANIRNESYYSVNLDNIDEAKFSAIAYKKLLIDYEKGNHASVVLQNGPILNELNKYIDLYRRGINEIQVLLEDIIK